jgi:hypothetical protein
MEKEIWKQIKDADKCQEISSFGRVRNIKGKVLSPSYYKNGFNNWYGHIVIRINKKQRTLYVHRLVAQTFLPNPENKETVNHKDGNKKNNFVAN